jgi:hypothetical protein
MGRQHPSVDDDKFGRGGSRLGHDFARPEYAPPETQQRERLKKAPASYHRGVQIRFFHGSKLPHIKISLKYSTAHRGHMFRHRLQPLDGDALTARKLKAI